MSHAAFLSAINTFPDDDNARLVYADFLDEQGNAQGRLVEEEAVRLLAMVSQPFPVIGGGGHQRAAVLQVHRAADESGQRRRVHRRAFGVASAAAVLAKQREAALGEDRDVVLEALALLVDEARGRTRQIERRRFVESERIGTGREQVPAELHGHARERCVAAAPEDLAQVATASCRASSAARSRSG